MWYSLMGNDFLNTITHIQYIFLWDFLKKNLLNSRKITSMYLKIFQHNNNNFHNIYMSLFQIH